MLVWNKILSNYISLTTTAVLWNISRSGNIPRDAADDGLSRAGHFGSQLEQEYVSGLVRRTGQQSLSLRSFSPSSADTSCILAAVSNRHTPLLWSASSSQYGWPETSTRARLRFCRHRDLAIYIAPSTSRYTCLVTACWYR